MKIWSVLYRKTESALIALVKFSELVVQNHRCPVKLFALYRRVMAGHIILSKYQTKQDEYFNTLVEFRNVAEGDAPTFLVKDSTLFVVSKTADGTQGIRRQRLSGISEATIPTTMRSVRIYEELNRVLSGRVDFNDMITRVAESFRQELLNDIYALWSSATADQFGGDTYFPTAGAYDEDALLELIAHVEAAAGSKTATLLGTKKALRNLKESIMSDSAKDELHTMGYVGTFYGTPVVATPQRHKIGTTEFVLDDNVISVIAGDDKPIKVRATDKLAA